MLVFPPPASSPSISATVNNQAAEAAEQPLQIHLKALILELADALEISLEEVSVLHPNNEQGNGADIIKAAANFMQGEQFKTQLRCIMSLPSGKQDTKQTQNEILITLEYLSTTTAQPLQHEKTLSEETIAELITAAESAWILASAQHLASEALPETGKAHTENTLQIVLKFNLMMTNLSTINFLFKPYKSERAFNYKEFQVIYFTHQISQLLTEIRELIGPEFKNFKRDVFVASEHLNTHLFNKESDLIEFEWVEKISQGLAIKNGMPALPNYLNKNPKNKKTILQMIAYTMPILQNAMFCLIKDFEEMGFENAGFENFKKDWAENCVPLMLTNMTHGTKTSELVKLKADFFTNYIRYSTTTASLHPNFFRMLCFMHASQQLKNEFSPLGEISNQPEILANIIINSPKNSTTELNYLNELFACNLIQAIPISISHTISSKNQLITSLVFKLIMSPQPKEPFKRFHKSFGEALCTRTLVLGIKQNITNIPFDFYKEPETRFNMLLALHNDPMAKDFFPVHPGHHQNIIAQVLPPLLDMKEATNKICDAMGEAGDYRLSPKNANRINPAGSLLWEFTPYTAPNTTTNPNTSNNPTLWYLDIPLERKNQAPVTEAPRKPRLNLTKKGGLPNKQSAPSGFDGAYLRLICANTAELGQTYNSSTQPFPLLSVHKQHIRREEDDELTCFLKQTVQAMYLCLPALSSQKAPAPRLLDCYASPKLFNHIRAALPKNPDNVIVFTPLAAALLDQPS